MPVRTLDTDIRSSEYDIVVSFYLSNFFAMFTGYILNVFQLRKQVDTESIRDVPLFLIKERLDNMKGRSLVMYGIL